MKKIWTNGCFDILHIGHIKLLEFAKTQGDYLIVGIDSDLRVKELKGKERPINSEELRKEFLLSIKYVDEVIIFDSAESLSDNIKEHNIGSIVVGDEYRSREVIGSEHAGVIFFEKIPNLSSTSIIEKIREK
jgi:D-beta-D-heptose 7-phosphate kinase/D-beta-D-heptose 1-phosphate adenosyltransferase